MFQLYEGWLISSGENLNTPLLIVVCFSNPSQSSSQELGFYGSGELSLPRDIKR